MSEKEIEQLKKDLHESSFKIKPILLELQNYSFFHSVQSTESEDVNDRFIGRRSIIDRIRSFVYETSKNTGTYLVSGFRGMGKTSVVNKALSSLNSKSKLQSFVLLWLFLLPISFFLNEALLFFTSFIESCFLVIITSLIVFCTIFYLGHRDPRRKHVKNDFLGSIRYGFVAIFNPNFQKHKHAFHNLLRNSLLYSIAILFFTGYYLLYVNKYNMVSKFEFFWFVNHIIVLWYILFDSFEELMKHKKRKGKYEISKSWLIILPFTIFIMLIIFHYLQCEFLYNKWGLLLKIFLFLIYFGLKVYIKKGIRDEDGRSYKTTLGRIITFFDLQHYITVKVNLGKDNLTEKDVLKYITNEFYKEYRKWYYNFRSFKRILNVILLLIGIYLISTIIYRTFLGNEFKSFSINECKIASFFPSQALLSVEDSLTHSMVKSLFITNGGSNSNLIKYSDSIKKNLNQDFNDIGYKSLEFNNKSHSQSYLNKALVKIGMICNEMDYLVLHFWCNVRAVVIGENFKVSYINVKNTVSGKKTGLLLSKVYPKIPALTVFVLMLGFIMSYRFIPNRFLILKTHFYFLRELKKLKNEIDASIIIEQGGGANNVRNSFFNYLKRTSYSPLESKDITQRLIHILDDVANINSIFTKIRLIFVFDELDKINSNHNTVISNLEDEFGDDNNEVRYQARRKERIGRILSSMKHFFKLCSRKIYFYCWS